MRLFRPQHSVVDGTTRLEAYSDAVIAIILTILVLELHVPELHEETFRGVFAGIGGMLPDLLSFAFSFLGISVFWVNHHHFFHEIDKTDGRFLWLNNALLFWLSLVPFTTAFLGEHPFVPGVMFIYCLVLFFAALSFMLMSRHAMIGGLLHAHITPLQRKRQYARNGVGVVLYAIATAAALFLPALSVILMFAIPVYYIAPRLMHDHGSAEDVTP